MTRALSVISACLLLGSCTQRMICPAYQSAFIYDKDELRKKFSYFEQDSTPKVFAAGGKNKYLIAEQTSYKARMRRLQTVAMKPVAVVVPDSLTGDAEVSQDELARAAQSVIDSTFVVDVPQEPAPAADSAYVITVDREVRVLKYNGPDSLDFDSIRFVYVPQKPEYYIKEVGYNMEQDNYMWYMRDAIVLPDVKLANDKQGKRGSQGTARRKKGSGGFFKNLFRKKSKEPSDSLETPGPEEQEFDFIDSDSVAVAPDGTTPSGARKGLLARKKVNSNRPPKSDAKPTDKKKEDEGDGF